MKRAICLLRDHRWEISFEGESNEPITQPEFRRLVRAMDVAYRSYLLSILHRTRQPEEVLSKET